MLRKLVDYKKLDRELATLLIESYPDGYGDDDIIVFKNAQGEYIEAVEIQTPDTLYLVKISKSLAKFISDFEDNMERELEIKEEPILEEVESLDYDNDFDAEQDSDEDIDFDRY